MKYLLHCPKCHQSCWCRGQYEPDTNATVINENDFAEWQEATGPGCNHEDYIITDEEYPDGED